MSAQASLGLDTGPFSLVPNETDSPVAAIASDEIFETKTLEIVAYTVLFVLGAPANLRVLFILLKAKCFKKSRHHLLLLHLALADSLVSVLMIPVEIGWRVTNRWVAGEIACKAFQFLRVFGPYSSSLVLICISLDRYYAVMDPFNYASCQTDSKIKKMLWFIWGLAAALSLPQIVIFTVQPHPHYSWFKQCVDFGTFSEDWQKLYNIASLFPLYILPLLVIAFCYAHICWMSFGRTRSAPAPVAEQSEATIEMELTSNWNNSSENTLVPRISRASQRHQRQTILRRNILKQTVVIVVAFVICWSPYVFITLWYQLDPMSAKALSPKLSGLLFIFAVSNSSLNPFIYGKFVNNQHGK